MPAISPKSIKPPLCLPERKRRPESRFFLGGNTWLGAEPNGRRLVSGRFGRKPPRTVLDTGDSGRRALHARPSLTAANQTALTNTAMSAAAIPRSALALVSLRDPLPRGYVTYAPLFNLADLGRGDAQDRLGAVFVPGSPERPAQRNDRYRDLRTIRKVLGSNVLRYPGLGGLGVTVLGAATDIWRLATTMQFMRSCLHLSWIWIWFLPNDVPQAVESCPALQPTTGKSTLTSTDIRGNIQVVFTGVIC